MNPLNDALRLDLLRVETRRILAELIGPPGTPVALLDTPRHRNLGDSLIWQGEVDYLAQLGLDLVLHID